MKKTASALLALAVACAVSEPSVMGFQTRLFSLCPVESNEYSHVPPSMLTVSRFAIGLPIGLPDRANDTS